MYLWIQHVCACLWLQTDEEGTLYMFYSEFCPTFNHSIATFLTDTITAGWAGNPQLCIRNKSKHPTTPVGSKITVSFCDVTILNRQEISLPTPNHIFTSILQIFTKKILLCWLLTVSNAMLMHFYKSAKGSLWRRFNFLLHITGQTVIMSNYQATGMQGKDALSLQCRMWLRG